MEIKMSVVILLFIVSVFGYNKESKGKGLRPEIPDDMFLNDIHKDSFHERMFVDKGNILTGEALLQRHQERIQNFIGVNILPPNDKGYNAGNHYYKGDDDRSILNKYKRWYRPPRFPFTGKGNKGGNKGGILPTKGPPPTIVRPTREPTLRPIMIPSKSPVNSPTIGPIVSPSITPSISPSIAPSTAPTSILTLTPSSNPTDTPTASPSQSCNFTGQFEFSQNPPGLTPFRNLYVCEDNGEYFLGLDNGNNFTLSIGRSSAIKPLNDGEFLNATLLDLQIGSQPCFGFQQAILQCRFTIPNDVFQFNNTFLTKVSDVQDPAKCFQSSSNFSAFNDPLLFQGLQRQALHLTSIDNTTEDCKSNSQGLCTYRLFQEFDDTVRIACCDDAFEASFFTPNNADTILGATLVQVFDITGENDLYNVTEMTGQTCPLPIIP